MLLIAIEPLPAGVAAILAREGGRTAVRVDSGLTVTEVVRAENLAFGREGPAVVVMRDEL